jgi:hypothetical protein
MPRSVVRGGPVSSDQCIGYIVAKVRLVADIPCLLPHSISPHLYGPSLPVQANYSDLIAFLNPAEGFPDLRRLLQLALTVPVANVAAERSFSSMRKIRTYIRSTMGEQRMSSIALLNTESEMAKTVDLDQVVDIFAKLPSLRDTSGELNAANVRRLEL